MGRREGELDEVTQCPQKYLPSCISRILQVTHRGRFWVGVQTLWNTRGYSLVAVGPELDVFHPFSGLLNPSNNKPVS